MFIRGGAGGGGGGVEEEVEEGVSLREWREEEKPEMRKDT